MRELLKITPIFLTVGEQSTVSEAITRFVNAGCGRQEDEKTIILVFPLFSFSLLFVICSGFFLTINPSLVNDYYLIGLPFQSLYFEHMYQMLYFIYISRPLVAAATFKFLSAIIRSYTKLSLSLFYIYNYKDS